MLEISKATIERSGEQYIGCFWLAEQLNHFL